MKNTLGSVILRKTYTGQFPDNQQKINCGEQEQYLIKDAHEPIIPIDVFEKVQEEIKSRSNIEVVDDKAKRKSTHYSSKDTERIRMDE